MKLSTSQVDSFIKLYSKAFGVQLTYAEAEQLGQRLIEMIKITTRASNGEIPSTNG